MKTHQKEIMELGYCRADARSILHGAQRWGRDLRREFGRWSMGVAPGMLTRVRRERKEARP